MDSELLEEDFEAAFEERVEEMRAELLQYGDSEVLEMLCRSSIVDRETGMLTDYWLSLLNPNLSSDKKKELVSEQEDVVLSALAKLLQKRMK